MTKYILASASPRRVEILSKLGFEFKIVPSDAEERIKRDITSMKPEERVKFLAFLKSADVAEALLSNEELSEGDSYIIIGSDTVVSAEGEILEKPQGKADAERMIRLIEGREHEVFTAVSLLYLPKEILKGKESEGKQFHFYDELFDILENQNRELNDLYELGEKMKEEKREPGEMIERLLSEKKVLNTVFCEATKVQVYPMKDAEIEAYISGMEPYDKAGAYAIQGEFSKFIKGIQGDYGTVMGLPAGRLYHEIKDLFARIREIQ